MQEARALWPRAGQRPHARRQPRPFQRHPWLTADYATAKQLALETIETSRSIDHPWGQAEGHWRLAILSIDTADYDATAYRNQGSNSLGGTCGAHGSRNRRLHPPRLARPHRGASRGRNPAAANKPLLKPARFSGWNTWALAILAHLYPAKAT